MKSDICYATMRVSYKSMEMEKINDDICVRTYVICLSDIFLFKLLSSYFSIPFILFYLCSQFYLNTICTKDVFLPDFFLFIIFFSYSTISDLVSQLPFRQIDTVTHRKRYREARIDWHTD